MGWRAACGTCLKRDRFTGITDTIYTGEENANFEKRFLLDKYVINKIFCY